MSINLVPSHSRNDWFKFLNNNIGVPILRSNWCGGDPLKFKVYENSSGYKRFNSSIFPDDRSIVS